MSLDIVSEARRQLEICNACRYCEGYCSVFPAVTRTRRLTDGDIAQLANLCHNCRGCYYACQYTAPHEFDLNVPAALADLRTATWERFVWPQGVGRLFQRNGLAVTAVLLAAFVALFAWRPLDSGTAFYTVLPHTVMVSLFTPLFLLPLVAVAIGLRRYWRHIGGMPIRIRHLTHAISMAARLKDLSGGQGQGCNFEIEDRYSNTRRWFHQAVMYGFLLCFAATAIATVMHYLFDMPAPYGWPSLPKLFGVPGGVLLAAGSAGTAALKLKADRHLGAPTAWGAEMAFIVVLFIVAVTGLFLAGSGGTPWVPVLLATHLGSVATLFVLLPYSKMVHGFFRLTALVRDAQTLPDSEDRN